MGLPLKQVEAAALELSMRERAQLASCLIASRDEDVTEDSFEVERAWDERISHTSAPSLLAVLLCVTACGDDLTSPPCTGPGRSL